MRSVILGGLFAVAGWLGVAGQSLAAVVTTVPIALNTKIGIDVGPTPTANWNNFSANGTIGVGSVLNLNGQIVSGVSLTFATANGAFNNDGTDNWGGLASNGGSLPPEFVESVVTDIAFRNGAAMTLSINGLNPAFKYNIYAVTTVDAPRTDTITVSGATTTISSLSRPTTLASPFPFHTFLDIVPTSGGALSLSISASPSNPILNGVLLVAVPEARSWLTLGVVGIGTAVVVAVRRKRERCVIV